MINFFNTETIVYEVIEKSGMKQCPASENAALKPSQMLLNHANINTNS